jgi:uncharacterized membrane protein YkgB
MAVTGAALVLALVLMLVFDHVLTRVFGVAAIFTFIVSGVFLIATPDFIAADDDRPLRREGVDGSVQ